MAAAVLLALLTAGAVAGFWVASILGCGRRQQQLAPEFRSFNRTFGADSFVGGPRATGTGRESSIPQRTALPEQQEDFLDGKDVAVSVHREPTSAKDGDALGEMEASYGTHSAPSSGFDEIPGIGSLKHQQGTISAAQEVPRNEEMNDISIRYPVGTNFKYIIGEVTDLIALLETPSTSLNTRTTDTAETLSTDSTAPTTIKEDRPNDMWFKEMNKNMEKKPLKTFSKEHRRRTAENLRDLWFKQWNKILEKNPVATFSKERRSHAAEHPRSPNNELFHAEEAGKDSNGVHQTEVHL